MATSPRYLWSSGTQSRRTMCALFHDECQLTLCLKIVTVGDKHIKFWTVVGGGLTSKRGTFGAEGKLDTMLCVAFGNDGTAYSGGANGLVYRCDGPITHLFCISALHADGVITLSPRRFRATKAPSSQCAVSQSTVLAMNTVKSSLNAASDAGFVTGGKDGNINVWDAAFKACAKSFGVSKDALSDDSQALVKDKPSVRAVCVAKVCRMPLLRAFFVILFIVQDAIVGGTSSGEVVLISPSGSVDVLIQGHAEGELWGLATHPTEPKYATVSDDKSLRIWNANVRCQYSPCNSITLQQPHRLLTVRRLKKPARCVAWSPDGKGLAMGLKACLCQDSEV